MAKKQDNISKAVKSGFKAVNKRLGGLEGGFKEVRQDIKEVRQDIKEVRHDLVSVEKKVDGILDYLRDVPTRDEFPELLRKTFEFATLKSEHELIKRILRDRLKVEI